MAGLINFAILMIYAFISVSALVFSKKFWPLLLSRQWGPMLKWLVAAGIAFALSFTILLFVLSRIPLSVAVPVAFGFNLSLASLAGYWIFREPINYRVLIGNCLVLIGSATLVLG